MFNDPLKLEIGKHYLTNGSGLVTITNQVPRLPDDPFRYKATNGGTYNQDGKVVITPYTQDYSLKDPLVREATPEEKLAWDLLQINTKIHEHMDSIKELIGQVEKLTSALVPEIMHNGLAVRTNKLGVYTVEIIGASSKPWSHLPS